MRLKRPCFPFPLLILLVPSAGAFSQERARYEAPYAGGTVVIEADQIGLSAAQTWVAEGDVVVTYEDTRLRTPRLIYRQDQELLIAEDGVEITRGIQWLNGTRGEFRLGDGTGFIENAEGFTDEEIFVKARMLLKTGPNTYVARHGLITSCAEAVPKWSFKAANAKIQVDSWATIKHTVLTVKKVPVFYLPYVAFPTGKKERSSGFSLPTIGNSNQKGRRVSESFYLVLGRSADILFREDYYSRRGNAHGATFRARPNTQTSIFLDAYTINDRLNQGGTSFNGTVETRFGKGFRLAADFNLATDFLFRRVFSDSFYLAVRPSEDSRIFVTNNFGLKSFNFRLSQQETVFPVRNLVTRSTPTFNFKVNGQRLAYLPLYLDLDATAEGVSRSDRFIETPSLVQRLDFQPRLYVSIPLFQGLRMTPRVSIRETFYSERLGADDQGRPTVKGDNLNRQYLQFELSLKGWGLSKIYSDGARGGWKHLIEPELRYRYINGIDDSQELVLFDETDAVANTNEIELALFNRIFVKKRIKGGDTTHEWLSLKLGQKYFFDTDFGGAFREGALNQFFPLYTFTGFPYAAVERRFSPLTTVARLNPDRRASIDVRGDFDHNYQRFRNFSVTGYWNRQLLSIGTTYYITQELEPGTTEDNQLQGLIRYGNMHRGLSASGVFSYDAKEKDFLNIRARTNYFWDCCGVALEFQRISVGLREERQLRFSFFLKGIGAFGTIRRPDSLF